MSIEDIQQLGCYYEARGSAFMCQQNVISSHPQLQRTWRNLEHGIASIRQGGRHARIAPMPANGHALHITALPAIPFKRATRLRQHPPGQQPLYKRGPVQAHRKLGVVVPHLLKCSQR